jgi:hypothetical protein
MGHVVAAKAVDSLNCRIKKTLGLRPDAGTFVIIPLRHENNRGRRWPYITIAIIALSALLFWWRTIASTSSSIVSRKCSRTRYVWQLLIRMHL